MMSVVVFAVLSAHPGMPVSMQHQQQQAYSSINAVSQMPGKHSRSLYSLKLPFSSSVVSSAAISLVVSAPCSSQCENDIQGCALLGGRLLGEPWNIPQKICVKANT